MYFAYITARVHQMIMQQWHAATTTRHSYTLTYQFLTDLQTLTRPRVASRYSVRPARGVRHSAPRRTRFRNPLDFTLISDFGVDFWISVWISADRFFLYVLGYFSYSSQLSKKFYLVVVLVN